MLKLFSVFFIALSIDTGTALDRIEFTVPSDWKLLKQKDSDSLFLSLYHISAEKINSVNNFSNSVFRSSFVDNFKNIEFANDFVFQHSRGAQKILSGQDGESWKTYLLLSNEKGKQYIMLYRIGIYNNICFKFMMAFLNKRKARNNRTKRFYSLSRNGRACKSIA